MLKWLKTLSGRIHDDKAQNSDRLYEQHAPIKVFIRALYLRYYDTERAGHTKCGMVELAGIEPATS